MNLSLSRVLCAAAILAGAAACKRQEIVVYTAPKDATPAPAPREAETGAGLDAAAPAPAARASLAKPVWTLPAGWHETGASGMNAASFAIQSDAGQASVSITPLP